jgi:hypothetical protein
MPLQTFGSVIKKLFGCIAALFCCTPGSYYAIFKRICNGGCRPRSFTRGFGNLLARPLQYSLRHRFVSLFPGALKPYPHYVWVF